MEPPLKGGFFNMKTKEENKLEIWKKKLQVLEQDYAEIMLKRGEAIAMGDLSENAAFQMLDEDASTYRVKIEEVKKIVSRLSDEYKQTKN